MKILEKLKLVEFVVDEYYICIEKNNEKIKFNRDSIKLNFSDDLLYNDFVYLEHGKYIMIFNFENFNSRLKIPLDYLIFKNISNVNGIYIFHNKVFIVRDNVLLNIINKIMTKEELNLLLFKYDLPLYEKAHNEYEKLLEISKKRLNIIEISKFFHIKTNFSSKIKELLNEFSKTILYATLFFAIFIFIFEFTIKNNYDNNIKSYDELKENNSLVKEKLFDFNNKIEKLDKINKKILNVDFYNRLNDILSLNLKGNIHVNNLKINSELMNLKVYSKEQSSIELLSYLENLKYLKNIRLKNSSRQKDYFIFEIEGELNK